MTEKVWNWLRWVLVAIEIAVFIFLAWWGVSIYRDFFAEAEGTQEEVWILCEPGGEVNVREKPKGRIFGAAACGACFWTDYKEKNGWLHVVEVPAECAEGWISTRYIVWDEPRSVMCELEIRAEGRVACRTWIGGKVKRWAHDGDRVMVYAMTDEWACTAWGYIRSEFIGEVFG